MNRYNSLIEEVEAGKFNKLELENLLLAVKQEMNCNFTTNMNCIRSMLELTRSIKRALEKEPA